MSFRYKCGVAVVVSNTNNIKQQETVNSLSFTNLKFIHGPLKKHKNFSSA